MNNDFLKKLEPQHIRDMVDYMYEKIFTSNQLVIQEGEPGNYLYVLAGLPFNLKPYSFTVHSYIWEGY